MPTTNRSRDPFPLYSLAWVREQHPVLGTLSYCGQVLSLRTPNGTRMVRRVPGHPGSLCEVPESALDALTAIEVRQECTHVGYAVVEGRGAFPVDMLRYEPCVPANFTLHPDTLRVQVAEMRGARHFGADLPLVAAVCGAFGPHWTPERWESFGWRVRPLRAVRITAEMEG